MNGPVPQLRGLSLFECVLLMHAGFNEQQIKTLAFLRKYRHRWH